MTKSVHMLKCEYEIHDDILCVGRVARETNGIVFYYSSMNEENKFVLPEQKYESMMTDYMSK